MVIRYEIGARSSAVEHYGDIVGVAGSNPAAPTRLNLGFIKAKWKFE